MSLIRFDPWTPHFGLRFGHVCSLLQASFGLTHVGFQVIST